MSLYFDQLRPLVFPPLAEIDAHCWAVPVYAIELPFATFFSVFRHFHNCKNQNVKQKKEIPKGQR